MSWPSSRPAGASARFLASGEPSSAAAGPSLTAISFCQAWLNLKKLDADFARRDGEPDPLDLETRASLTFSVAMFNLVCALMPPKLRRVVAVLGFPADRAAGLAGLRAVLAAPCARRPGAALVLLLHHVAIVSAVAAGRHVYTAEAEALLAYCDTLYPGMAAL